MDTGTFQLIITFNMMWWSVAALIALIVFYRSTRVQYEWVDDPIHDAAMPGNVHHMIRKHEEEGYTVTGYETRGVVQIVHFNKRVKRPILRTGQIWPSNR